MASSSAVAEKAPLGLAGRWIPHFNVKAFSAIFLYALRHWSTDMPSLPNMMAMILSASASLQGILALVVYKPASTRSTNKIEIIARSRILLQIVHVPELLHDCL